MSEYSAEKDAPRRLMYSIKDCGGCVGHGAHRRWCPYAVGETAAYFGQLSEQAESLGDSIGPNDTGAANMAWQLAALLRKRAEDARRLSGASVLPPAARGFGLLREASSEGDLTPITGGLDAEMECVTPPGAQADQPDTDQHNTRVTPSERGEA